MGVAVGWGSIGLDHRSSGIADGWGGVGIADGWSGIGFDDGRGGRIGDGRSMVVANGRRRVAQTIVQEARSGIGHSQQSGEDLRGVQI